MKKQLFMLLLLAAGIYSHTLNGQAAGTPASTPSRTVQPKIMVIPFVKENEDIRTVIENNPNARIAITKVKEAFDNRNFITVDFIARLKKAIDDGILTSGDQTDMKAQIAENSGADIYVEVDLLGTAPTQTGANRARILLKGYDCATGNSYGDKECVSRANTTPDIGALISNAMENCRDEFLNTMQTRFDDVVENGRAISLQFTLKTGSSWNFQKDIPGDDLPLDEVIESWIAENSVKNYYSPPSSPGTKLIYDEVRIPLKNDKGMNFTPTHYASQIVQFLKKKGIAAERSVIRGTIYISIK